VPDRSWRVLIVEDDYFIAHDLAKVVEQAGLEIVGPVPTLSRALVALDQERLDLAVLDINLDGDKVYEVADAMIGRSIPIMFVTGYDRASIPERYRTVPLCLKPIDTARILDVLRGLVGR